LEVKGSPDAPVFLLDSHPAEYFPEALTLQIIAFGRGNRTGLHWGIFTSPPSTRQPPPPPPNLQTRQVTDTPLTHETMMGLWFKAEWKHNGEVRPVSDLTWEESYNVWRGADWPPPSGTTRSPSRPATFPSPIPL
jgi:hypothetical protein